ncbi:MAG TPA: phosphotransferase family protein [Acidimicrobiales bacterium]
MLANDAEAVRRWIESVVGGTVESVTRKTGGASRSTNMVVVHHDDRRVEEVVLRLDTGDGPFSGTRFTLAREAATYQEVSGTDVPVPEVLAVSDDGSAVLMRRVAGHDSDVIPNDERTSVAESYVRAIAALHALDPQSMSLDGFARPTTPADRSRLEIDTWTDMLTAKVHRPEPVVDFAIAWLRDHLPTTGDETVMCWGDVGPGNFLYEDGKVTALLDWELAHLGDPMDDLAFHSLRSHLLFDGGFCELDWLLDRYEELSGRTIDVDRFDHYQAACLVRWIVTPLAALDNRAGAEMAGSTYLFLIATVRVWMAEVLARLIGVELDEVAPFDPVPATDDAEVVSLLMDDLLGVIMPAVSDDAASQRLTGMAMLLDHLGAAQRIGAAVDDAELADLTALLGTAPASIHDGLLDLRDRIRAGRPPATSEDMVQYFGRSAVRRAQLWPFLRSYTSRPVPSLGDRSC